MKLETDYKDLWELLKHYMPELKRKKKEPKDRAFFFNILNTLSDRVVDKMVYHAEEARISKSKIEDEITVIPEFRDIFTD